MTVQNTFGDMDTYATEGVIEFTLQGQTLRLRPFTTRPKRFYIVFRDASAGQETYETARFLYADLQDDGTTVLDFNEAYNPPCSFNPYTTCPIPLKENILPVKILAGEKAYPIHVSLPEPRSETGDLVCRGVGGLRAVRACGRVPTGAASSTLPSTPLTYGFFTVQFSGDGTFSLRGEGWPTFAGKWTAAADLDLNTPGIEQCEPRRHAIAISCRAAAFEPRPGQRCLRAAPDDPRPQRLAAGG